MVKDLKTVIIERIDLKDSVKDTRIDKITLDMIKEDKLSLKEITHLDLILFVDINLSARILKSSYTKIGDELYII